MESDRAIGSRRWAIADGYLPGWSNGPEPELTSHESFSVLNANDEDMAARIIAGTARSMGIDTEL